MSALLMLGLWACQAVSAAPRDLAPGARAQARVSTPSARVELGEPFELVLEVRHAAGDTPSVEPGELADDIAWQVLDGGELLTLPDGESRARRLSEVRWTVVALEPGSRALPAPRVHFAAGEGRPELELEIERAELEVAAVLAPGEDAPRELPDYLGLPAAVGAAAWWPAGLAAAVLALAAALIWRGRARARAAHTAKAGEPAPLARLALLESSELQSDEELRAAHFTITHALREHVDGAGRANRKSLTDEEWAASLGAAADLRLPEFLADCGAVKYGAAAPTHWATRERAQRARELAEGLAQHGAEVAR